MAIRLGKESALDLPLEGSVGSFSVGTGLETQNAFTVKYFLTHVALDFNSTSNDRLLDNLAPVREIFDFQSLDFDELMQRDIDDARVSHDLIPYILDDKSHDLLKLFPPIIVFVLPVDSSGNRPADVYPEVEINTQPPPEGDESGAEGYHYVRSGPIGNEAFKFEQPIYDGQTLDHDLVKLRLNTQRVRLVIVDGQHRAMALLALHRNIKDQWSHEKRAPYKAYYAHWTTDYISQFNLSNVKLPVMLCTVPGLDENYNGEFDVKKAARSVFLTLNKTARKVSESRNRLLDDSDLIAEFMRDTLSVIKSQGPRSPSSLRVWNVELDQHGDRLKIQSPVAVTGVNHIYYLIEHMMLHRGDVRGALPRSGKFFKRKDLTAYPLMERLNGYNKLGTEVANATYRDNYSHHVAQELSHEFFDRYGRFIIRAFEEFLPYEYHNKAAVDLNAALHAHRDQQLIPIFFEGQGIFHVFQEHRESLARRIKNGEFGQRAPEMRSIQQQLDQTAKRVEENVFELKVYRATEYLSRISDKSKLKDSNGDWERVVLDFINKLYDTVYSTVAFQAALLCGFFETYEAANSKGALSVSKEDAFTEYMSQLNTFFVPTTAAQVKRLIRVFEGDVSGDTADEWTIKPSKSRFRHVVYRGEMQPDQWPKYKYLLEEVWEPSDPILQQKVSEDREYCRRQIVTALDEDEKDSYCRDQGKLESELSNKERENIFKRAHEAFSGFLQNLGRERPGLDMIRQYVGLVEPPPEEATDEEEIHHE